MMWFCSVSLELSLREKRRNWLCSIWKIWVLQVERWQ